MADVPEHLLSRSKQRRAMLAGQPVEASTGAAEASATIAGGAVASGALETVAAGGGQPPTGLAAAAFTAGPEEPIGPPRNPANHIPWWAWPALVTLPLVLVMYLGAFGQTASHAEVTDPIVLGEGIYAAQCASCHGANGQGGVGRVLWKGEVLKTFPEKYNTNSGAAATGIEAQKAWVRGGSTTGLPYGDPNRDGGQQVSRGGMPAFGGTLSEAQIDAVVQYERSKLG